MTSSQNENTPQSSKKRNSKKTLIIVLISIAGLILALCAALIILITVGKHGLHSGDMQVSAPEDVSATETEDYIEYEGEKYTLNKNIVSVLFLGVDKKNINDEKNAGANGQADAIFLACFDTKTGSIKIIPINRDTMADISLYSSEGNYSGTKNEQICLSYAYGSTAEESCENVKKDVSRLLCGVNISSYVAIDLKGVSAVTDIIGGVSLTSIETIGSFKEGQTVALKGEKAVEYIQKRGNDIEAATRRMLRQKQFLTAFASAAGNQLLSDFSKLGTFYNTAIKYTLTDIDFAEATYLAKCCLTTNLGSSIDYISIEGNAVAGEEHVEFYADNNSIYKAVLECFYTKVE